MHADEYSIERYEPSWHAGLMAIERGLWSPDPETTSRHFDWKYRDNPFGDQIHFYLAIHQGRVVGANGMYWSRWEHDHTSTLALCRADTVIDPEHRGRGILGRFFTTLRLDLRERGIPYLVGTSAGAPVTYSAVKDGWRRCEPLDVSRREGARDGDGPGPVGRLVRRVFGSRRSGATASWADADGPTAFPGVTQRSEPSPEDMAGLVQSLPHDGRIRHVRDAGYLRWRFQNPLSEFRFLVAGADSMRGYLIAQTHADPVRRTGTHVIDFESMDEGTSHDLVRAAVASFGHATLSTSTNHLDDHRGDALRRHGFEPESFDDTGFRPAIIVRSTGDDDPAGWRFGSRLLTDFDEWDWRDLYSDNH